MKKKYIFFSGGLGNQLFQMGAYLKLREKYPLITVDLTALNFPIRGETKRAYELGDYIYDNVENGSLLRRYMLEVSRKIRAPFLSYETLDLDSVWYYGYFQKKEYAAATKNYLNDIKFINIEKIKNNFAFHFRLGDFVNNRKASKLSGVIDESYILNALKLVPENCQIDVFSDEPKKAKEILEGLGGKNININFSEHKKNTPWEDIKEISTYKNVICSNSTFSYWGAYLGIEKKVIAPSRWFSNSDVVPEYLPKSWIYI
jgi:hypothetical protein